MSDRVTHHVSRFTFPSEQPVQRSDGFLPGGQDLAQVRLGLFQFGQLGFARSDVTSPARPSFRLWAPSHQWPSATLRLPGWAAAEPAAARWPWSARLRGVAAPGAAASEHPAHAGRKPCPCGGPSTFWTSGCIAFHSASSVTSRASLRSIHHALLHLRRIEVADRRGLAAPLLFAVILLRQTACWLPNSSAAAIARHY